MQSSKGVLTMFVLMFCLMYKPFVVLMYISRKGFWFHWFEVVHGFCKAFDNVMIIEKPLTISICQLILMLLMCWFAKTLCYYSIGYINVWCVIVQNNINISIFWKGWWSYGLMWADARVVSGIFKNVFVIILFDVSWSSCYIENIPELCLIMNYWSQRRYK